MVARPIIAVGWHELGSQPATSSSVVSVIPRLHMHINMAFDQCRFADCLAKYEAIWNVKAKDHGNKERRKAQIQALADECGISVDLAETKYTSLRTYFVKQRRKVKESQKNGCGQSTIYRPSWPPYSSLTFLEKTLDLQNSADMMSDCGISLSMVENPRTSLSDNMGLVTMADPGSPVGRASVNGVRSPVPEVNTIILSMPDKSESPSPSSTTSPLPETTMRIPMPEGLRLPIKMEDKEPMLDPEDFQEFTRVRHIDDSPPVLTSLRPENTPSSHSSPHALSTRSSYSVFPVLTASATSQPSSISAVCPSVGPSSSISCLPASHSSLPYSFPHSLTSALPSSVALPGKSRKRALPKDDGSQIGVILQDAVESLRTITGNCREDANDDVGGFLKMTGYQLRSIQDPIRRMRLMHTIQGHILAELSSPFSKQTDETAGQKSSETMDAFT